MTWGLILAERAGFEPAVGSEPTHAFQACDLNRSSTFPRTLEYIRQRAAGLRGRDAAEVLTGYHIRPEMRRGAVV